MAHTGIHLASHRPPLPSIQIRSRLDRVRCIPRPLSSTREDYGPEDELDRHAAVCSLRKDDLLAWWLLADSECRMAPRSYGELECGHESTRGYAARGGTSDQRPEALQELRVFNEDHAVA